MAEKERGGFTSKFGVLMAVAGSAVGIGNIWRFPYLAGQNGGAAFIIIYICMVLLIGLPIVLSEFSLGMAAGAGPIKVVEKTTGKKNSPWNLIGYLSALVGVLLIGYYAVVSGWVLRSVEVSIEGEFMTQTTSEIRESLSEFTSSIGWPIFYGILFLGISSLIVRKGIKNGVEKWSKILMPALFVMMILLCINSMTLEGWEKGVDFLFNPDWSKVTGRTFIDALGQVFFTLSIGMGVMITYGSYTGKDENMFKSKGFASIIDTSVAIFAGVAIFPAVFTFGLEAGQGPELVFVTLPTVFSQLAFGNIYAILFFSMLSIAALTSIISIQEMLVTLAEDKYKISRNLSTLISFVIGGVMVVACAASSFAFDSCDYLTANVFMPLCGLLIVLFVGWGMGRKLLYNTFTADGKYSTKIFSIFLFLVRYLAPIAIILIFLSGLGII